MSEKDTSVGDEEQPVGRLPPETGTRYSAKEIHDTVVQSALDELHRPLAALWWSAFAAGLIISFSFLAAGFLASLSRDVRWEAALAAAGYPLGFIFVVLSSTQLFTENTLDPILPLLERPDWKTLRRVARLWGVLLVGNLIGAAIIAFIFAWTPLLPAWLQPTLEHVARGSTSDTYAQTFLRGIFGGWLIALMAWLVNTTVSRLAQMALIWLTTAPIAAFGFRHSIAGSVEAMYLAARGQASWGDMLLSFQTAAVLGNAVGGVILVALLFYGQVRADKRASREDRSELDSVRASRRR